MLLFYWILIVYTLDFYLTVASSHILLIISSVSLYFISVFLFRLIGVEISAGLDSINHYDLIENRSHIVSCAMIKEQIDVDKIIGMIKERAFQHPLYEKLKKVMKTRFFIDYWTYADHFSIEDHIQVLTEKFTSHDDLYKFMTAHASEKKFPEKKPKWKIFLAINVFGGRSALIMKFHHAIGDGVAIMSYTFNLGDCGNYMMVNLPKIKTWQRILLTPIGLIKAGYYTAFYLFQKRDNNMFKKQPLCGKKQGFGSLKFEMKELKAYARKNGVNLNDVILGLINQSLRTCHMETYKQSLDEFKIFVAASLRGLPKPGDHFPLTNLTNFLTLEEFPHIKSSFIELVHNYHKILNKLKSNYDFYFRGFYVELLNALIPKSFSLYMTNHVTDRSSCIFTSVPGPLKTLSMFGYDIEDLFFFVTSPGLVAIMINVFTYHEKLTLCCLADESTGLNTKRFIEELERLVTNEILDKKDNN